ncbi:hypothetical protein SAMD00019534_019780 [Acytostelium subglobosum LB1]|uniref:hypothetical protein n=1 Tax=Acytostelium subglobosum LB1 TaxID=1410327 RepID=UPI0006451919|nr:hypothetical protein SAMD00019534_019780 [Acytostelium subglobosum LB1]GAM18803.1 hypothetical protein SAMD00019534_019780 [Acytostelium subglobosum LB1]|eukprot:XP_012758023.1 hypothetical protein SAMD00019534_019780 [Acytostelium subglobosum LB1]
MTYSPSNSISRNDYSDYSDYTVNNSINGNSNNNNNNNNNNNERLVNLKQRNALFGSSSRDSQLNMLSNLTQLGSNPSSTIKGLSSTLFYIENDQLPEAKDIAFKIWVTQHLVHVPETNQPPPPTVQMVLDDIGQRLLKSETDINYVAYIMHMGTEIEDISMQHVEACRSFMWMFGGKAIQKCLLFDQAEKYSEAERLAFKEKLTTHVALHALITRENLTIDFISNPEPADQTTRRRLIQSICAADQVQNVQQMNFNAAKISLKPTAESIIRYSDFLATYIIPFGVLAACFVTSKRITKAGCMLYGLHALRWVGPSIKTGVCSFLDDPSGTVDRFLDNTLGKVSDYIAGNKCWD